MGKNSINVPHRKGQGMLELAVSVMVLLILVAGMIDVGRAIFYYLAMRDAAEEGMVYAVVYPTFCNQIVQAVRNNMDDSGVDVQIHYGNLPGVACASASTSQACADQQVTITVTQPNFPITMPLIGGFLGTQSLSLKAEIKGTVVRPECGP
jgi:Flp pilus assembly protein TadG